MAIATTAEPSRGPSLEARLRDRIRRARPQGAVVGRPLPRVVTEAGKPDSALLTDTAERAIDALCDRPETPDETLEAMGWELIAYVRARRGVRPPSLGVAMRREQAANAGLDLAQWCVSGPLTLGDLHAMRDRVGEQYVADRDLLDALDGEIARLTPRGTSPHALAA